MFRDVQGCSRMFRDVPGCSGMFRNVPGCSMFRVLSTPTSYITFAPANSLSTNQGGGAEDILQVQGLSIDGLITVKTLLLYNKLT